MFLSFKRFRVLCISLVVILVGSYTYVAKWCLLPISDEEYFTRPFIEELLPQAQTTNHKQVSCTPWKSIELEYPEKNDRAPDVVKWRGVQDVTSPIHSTTYIVDWKSEYQLCDKVKARIEIRNWRNETKNYGGDYLRAKLTSQNPYASANADYLFDYGNGSYMAYFTVRWAALDVEVQVILVHPREAVDILRRLQKFIPDRFVYAGRYNLKGNTSIGENVPCHVSSPNVPVCNLSDTRIHAPWYCARPSTYNLTCADYSWHRANNVRANEEAGNLVTENEGWLFFLQKKQLTSFNHQFNVSDHVDETSYGVSGKLRNPIRRPYCKRGQVPRTFKSGGYFYNETWYPYKCRVHPFTVTEALTCMQNKYVYFFGDSTVRQLYEFFLYRCWKTFKSEHIRTLKFWKVGPLKAYDNINNITMEYRHHGLPIRNNWTWVNDIRYVANELEDLKGGSNVIVVISLWAHFTATSFSFYEKRIRDIKAAVERVWQRSPETTVILKGANTRAHSGLSYALYASDWYANQLEHILRTVFLKEKRIGFLDAWDMTQSHHYPDAIHPPHDVVANMVNILLTFLCKG